MPDEIRGSSRACTSTSTAVARYQLGDWPEEDTRAFDPEGAVAFYETPPEGEEPPDYPSPAG